MKKQCKRKVYALVNPIAHAMAGAGVTDPKLLDRLRIRELSAIESFRTGAATRQDWMDVADFLNITETLATEGIGPEALEACQRAQQALSEAFARRERTGKLGVTGPELQSMRDCYEFHDLQRTSISRARYEQAIAKTANRIRSAHPSVKVCMDNGRAP
jgi:hypothetical protein